MRAEEEQAQLEKELAAERAGNARLRQMMEEVLRRLGEVEGKWRGIATIAANPHRAMGWFRKERGPRWVQEASQRLTATVEMKLECASEASSTGCM